MVKFGIEFVPYEPYWRTVFYAVQAEKRGFDHVWITDHYNNRNVYVTLTSIALFTRKIAFGTGVTNPYLINPVMTAQSIATLSEMAPNRVVLGIGAGDKVTLESLGVRWVKPLKAIREAVKIFRGLLNEGKARLDGEIFKVANARLNFKPRGKIPIYIGAQAPKMLKLAGEIGDGVLINASHPRDIEGAVKHVREGIERAGKDPSQVDIVAYTAFSIDRDENKAIQAASPVVAFIVAGSPKNVLERHGIDVSKAQEIGNELKKGNFSKAFSLVTKEMIDAFSVTGTPEQCIEKINELIGKGVTQIVVGSPIGPNVRRSIDLVSSEVMPHFKK